MKRKLLAILLATFMLFTTSVTALATDMEDDPNSVDVTLSFTLGTEYYSSDAGDILLLEEMTVPYFDLELYGWEDYYYNPDCYTAAEQIAGTKAQAEGNVTMLHAIIYATERYALGMPVDEVGQGALYQSGLRDEYIELSGAVGSSFINNFWNEGYNLNYYVNYEYPLGSHGWGATVDQILLQDGDHISIHRIADDTWTMTGSSFGYLAADGKSNAATVKKGESITLDMKYTDRSYESSSTVTVAGADIPLYYNAEKSADPSQWTSLGSTDSNGQITIDTTDWAAGTYYIGTNSADVYLGDNIGYSMEPVPAVFELTVEEDTVYGDINGDSKVNSTDASLILRYASGKISSIDAKAADVSGDGKVNSTDASLILRYSAGIITVFPAVSNK